MNLIGVGIDIVETSRFLSFKKNRDSHFLLNNYGKEELDYCFSFKNPVPHLAGTFAAKEAVFKALARDDILLSLIRIKRGKNRQPVVWIKNTLQKSIMVSISHIEKIAVAVAVKK
ncbi:MAG: 4'-phosphopantetheinyl transferase superfamily protein [bacterium]|nr:4'-phosphopantetheinyl transferase superfamily protein [bacterium]